MGTVRAAIYTRVSTFNRKDQAAPEGKGKRGQDTDVQLRVLKEAAVRKGWDVVLELEEEASGTKARRPKRDELLKLARQRKVDVVMVWKLDRWGRSMADLAVTLSDLRELGVGFYSETEALDFTTPSGRLMAGLLSVFAEFERDLIVERIMAGLENAKAKGKRLGRKPISEELAAAIIRALQEGIPWPRIMREANVGRMTVARVARGLKEAHTREVEEAGGPEAFAAAAAKRILERWNEHRHAAKGEA